MNNCQSSIPMSLPIMTIDMRKRRIRLYKQTLRLLDNPEYVQFLVNPSEHIFAVKSSAATGISAQKIYWTILNGNGKCCEFYSKNLIETLQSHFFNGSDEHTYRVIGEYNDRKKAVIFDLNQSEPISYEPEAVE